MREDAAAAPRAAGAGADPAGAPGRAGSCTSALSNLPRGRGTHGSASDNAKPQVRLGRKNDNWVSWPGIWS